MRVLRLLELHAGADCLVSRCALDDVRFQVTIWYEGVDIAGLAATYGEHFERIALHVALFQLNAACSLRPETIELGPYARFLTQDLAEIWRTVFRNVWAQWRYEHDLPAYEGPRFVDPFVAAPPPIAVAPGDVELLAFGGGGKDSLVAAKLLERGGLPFATLGYSHSIYGAAEPQHTLLDRVGVATARVRAERQWILDDLLDAPIARLRPALGVKYILAAETPASVFAALPLALARGYRALVVAHEAGANTPNLVWNGEGVNHQWGKGWEAEQLLDGYVRRALLSNVRYFSLLQPVHDEVIFELLARDAQLATLTHSCNVQKPWCARCAKCVYVWLQMAAHLPPSIVEATFRKPVDIPENDHYFRQLLGLAEHTPFECVGSVAESRLALGQAIAKGHTALARYVVERPDPRPLLEVGDTHGMPAHVAACVMPQFREAAASAAKRLLYPKGTCSPGGSLA
jgi:UDP-N-acetyl-alpha-D-muramoyl-L-alanyl-L-glutamate epimerase